MEDQGSVGEEQGSVVVVALDKDGHVETGASRSSSRGLQWIVDRVDCRACENQSLDESPNEPEVE